MTNRLANATSPYLLQHKDNPVDWFEWSDEAFTRARSRDVPVLLSVGYSACHWCHVMAHESFEDQLTADYLNAHFVSVKVDREERPDIDAVYMEATQAMTGQGGWPMTCVLTPDGAPFFAGTYFPLQPRQGMPAFRQVLRAVVDAWSGRRDEMARMSVDIANHLRRAQPLPERTTPDVGAGAVEHLTRTFDTVHGGFGAAPKFPPSMVCEFLLRRAARVGDQQALTMAERTLEAMARGGMYDQLGGGFARYSVDERWDVPHFEKMLYDNALLLRVYLHWARQSGLALPARIARETADFLLRELRTDEGGFASALDADSDGAEGTFYVWTPEQIVEVLGADDGRDAARVFGVGHPGNFEHGASTLRLDTDPDDAHHRDLVRRLLAARDHRTRPARDDKVVAAWNGLTIVALAEAAMILDEPRYLEAAQAAGALLVDVHLAGSGQLRRVSRDGIAGEPAGVLEDYACLADGLLTLFGSTGDVVWFNRAQLLLDRIRVRFGDGDGGFFDTADDAEVLLKRPQDPTDNVTPSGQSTTASVLATMSAYTGDGDDRRVAEALLSKLAGLAEEVPRFAGHILSVAEALTDGPRQVAVVGAETDPARRDLLRAAYRLPHPGVVVAQGTPGQSTVALLDRRGLVGGRAAAYVCRDFICDLPVTSPDDLV
ncbi:MAG: thioredoxin domain-containing protein [Propionibacteriales bacterium]|nr:thioredoxin domain-containing protein [Propionibacteriales bacterium]